MSKAKIRVPIEPIIEHIKSRGEISDLFPKEEVFPEFPLTDSFCGDTMMNTEGRVYEAIHRDYKLAYERTWRRLDRAVKAGWIDYFVADEICCDLFGFHPVTLFGAAWWDMPNDKALQDRLAGRTPKAAAA